VYGLTDNGGGFGLETVFDAKAPVGYPPAISADGSRVFFGNDTGVFCIDAQGGLLWRTSMQSGTSSALAIGTDGVVYVGCDDGCLYGLSVDSGVVLYTSNPSGASVVGSPVIGFDRVVYFDREDGSIVALQDGVEIWDKTLPNAELSSAPCLAPDSTVLIHTDDDVLYALRLFSEDPVWSLDLSGTRGRRFESDVTSSPTIGLGNSKIYVGGNNSTSFYAVWVDKASYKSGLPATPWPKSQCDEGNRGGAGE
jgi:outer membrane protein assembly factor BamB